MALTCAGNAEQALEFDASHISEVWSNVDGGIKEDTRYLAYGDLGISVDGMAALGWKGMKARVSAIYSNGVSVTEMAGASQPLSNIETDVSSVWLYEAWVEHVFSNKISVKVGLQEINEEFDASETRAVFLHSSHGVGGEFGSSGVTGPSTYPYTGLGIRVKQSYKEGYYVQLGVFDGVPGNPAAPKSTAIKLDSQEGALIVIEAGYEQGNVKVSGGVWRYTATYDDILEVDSSAQPLNRKGNDGFYGLVEVPVWTEADGQGLVGFIRAGVADSDFNTIDGYWSAGGVYTGLFSGRDTDQIGFAVVVTEAGQPYRQSQALIGEQTNKREVSVELTYKAPLANWAYIQPDIQYVINPGMNPVTDNTLLFGLRLGLEW